MTKTIAELAAFYDEFHATQNVVDRERIRHAEKPLLAFFGQMAVADIDDVQLVRYERGRRAGHSGRAVGSSTIRRELQHLRAVIRFASRNTRHTGVRRDDVPHFPLPAKAEPRALVLTDTQMDEMMAAVQPRGAAKLTPAYVFLALARWTAARRDAIECLTWDRVDLGACTIDYREPGRPLTAKRRAKVPIIDAGLLAVLQRAAKERVEDDPYVVPGGVSTRKARERAARVAGVPDATAHTFRHTWATRKIREGVPPAIVAKFLGDTVQTVLANYVHITEDDVMSAFAGRTADAMAAK